jgi:hypothetical protein
MLAPLAILEEEEEEGVLFIPSPEVERIGVNAVPGGLLVDVEDAETPPAFVAAMYANAASFPAEEEDDVEIPEEGVTEGLELL